MPGWVSYMIHAMYITIGCLCDEAMHVSLHGRWYGYVIVLLYTYPINAMAYRMHMRYAWNCMSYGCTRGKTK